ncbi:hypothetical protein [uncultured Tateyamaria sp.]|uniref:hypothetical protein n=1 Tax=uncultured Tateyamaria sp. TaxID=455651 RepID=UPI0026174235|nr:hypothetical protein [uncultured Tateyamaria sp.]
MPSSTPLLVPLALEALMVNDAVVAHQNWYRGLVDYAQLNTFNDPQPQPSQMGQPPKTGIHLHWALPKALVHGTQIRATAEASLTADGVGSLALINPGSSYVVPPTITLTGGGGTGAAAVAELHDGAVSAITVLSAGTGYTSAPKVEIAPSPEVCFPLVPNRWMITRFDPATSTDSPRQTTSWILTSDEVSTTDGAAPFVDPTTSTDGQVVPTNIGVSRLLSAWQGESSAAGTDLFLRAIGPGEMTFHAFQPGAENVFGIYDDLGSNGGTLKVPYPENAAFTYQVVGWYSDPNADPLYGEVTHWGDNCTGTRTAWTTASDPEAAWTALMEHLNWQVDNAPTTAAEMPNSSLYHGMIHTVTWTNVNIPPRINPNANGMTVCVGNTAADALSALVASHATSVDAGTLEVQELEALNFNALKTLDKADGAAQIEALIHDAWFSTQPGGTTWDIVAASNDSFAGLTAAAMPPGDPLTHDQQVALAQLNQAQVALDSALRDLQSMKWSLFATWWKDKRSAFDTDWQATVSDPDQILKTITDNLDPTQPGLYKQVIDQEAALGRQAAALPQPTNPISIAQYAASVLKLDPAQWTLKASGAEPFHAPVDPVVMVAGLQPSDKQKTQHPQYTSGTGWDDTLICRTQDETATGIITGVENSTDISPASVFSAETAMVTNPHFSAALQGGISALCTETFLADPQNAATMVAVVNGGPGNTAQITALSDAISDFQAPVTTQGTPALREHSAYVTWQQAWSPLYLQWTINFYATTNTDNTGNAAPGEQCDNWGFDLGDWAFDGTDYAWTGGNPAHGSQGYSGRTFLTGQANFALISRLHHYITTAKAPEAGLQAVEGLIETVGEMNFMSQRLTGLSDALVMRTVNPSNPPSDDIAPHIGAQYNETPDPTKGNQTLRFGMGNPFFFPVRGGYMTFEALSVVDAFGQTLDLMTAGGNGGTGPAFRPLCGAGLAPPPDQNVSTPSLLKAVYLQPRVVQPARLNFDFLSASDDSKILGQTADVNPVCGWIIPNHLDRALNIYDADGIALGELIELANTTGTAQLGWLPAPNSTGAVTDPGQITNSHLGGFVQGLLARADGAAGFRNFLSCVDETQWTVDPLGARKDQNLSVLIGRPLALVRCKLGLELDGQPYTNQSWRDTLQNLSAGLEGLEWDVRLGSLDLFDDGLMGYYTGDSYDSFHAVHDPQGLAPANPPYLNPIAPGNYLRTAFDGTDQVLTMVLDPRGDVHLTTGILPTRSVALPDAFVAPAMGQFALSFRTGPVISETAQVRVPYPTERHGDWAWAQLSEPTPPGTAPSYTVKSLVKAGQEARLDSAPPALMEGWLTFTPDGTGPDDG